MYFVAIKIGEIVGSFRTTITTASASSSSSWMMALRCGREERGGEMS